LKIFTEKLYGTHLGKILIITSNNTFYLVSHNIIREIW